MKTITKYQAEDGKEFTSIAECVEYDGIINNVKLIMADLPQRPDETGCSFENGGGFIQHDKANLNRVRTNLLRQINKHIKHNWIDQAIEDESIHHSWVGRLVSDYSIPPFEKAWYRFMCIDNQGREWGQPYFASNPEKSKNQTCLNTK